MSLGSNGWISQVRSDKFRRDFVARTFALIAPDWPTCTEFSAETKRSQMHPNITKCKKHEFKVPWCVSGEFLAKSSDVTFALIAPDWPIWAEISAVTKWS